jgi:hypothetical protein
MSFMLKIQWEIKGGAESEFKKNQEAGNPNSASKELLAGFGPTYHWIGSNSFVLNPKADKDSLV